MGVHNIISVIVSPLRLGVVVSIPLIGMLVLILIGCFISACDRRRRPTLRRQDTEALSDKNVFTDPASIDKRLLKNTSYF